ncbi:MAG: hypothetical protein AAB225_06200 [Acidobacteriota bacterium]
MRRSIAVLAALALLAGAACSAPVFRAGACAEDVTPRAVPVIVSGGFLAATAERIAGKLYARALALDDGERRIVIAVADSLMMPRELLDRVKQAASRTTGIPADHMLISATHTHSAPPVMGALGTDINLDYARFFEGQLVKVIEGAVQNLEPARVGWSVVQDFEHTHCRRWILQPDKVRKDPFGELTVRANMHPGYQNPDFSGPAGPVDPDLSVVSFQSPDGRPLALLANYSMHYVGAGGKVVSPDYYGPFVENMRRLLGADDAFVAMMSQGTSGDQQWMDYSQPKKDMNPQMYADALAAVAFEAFKKIQYRDWVPLAVRETKLTLSRRVPGPERLAWGKEIVARMAGAPPRNQQEVYAREQLFLAAEPVRELKLQALRLGDLGIAAIPNEVFAVTGLKIKARSPLRPTFNITLANGAEGYIPPPDQHALGGYTTWPARTAGLEVNAEPKIVESVLGLLERVSGQRRRAPAVLVPQIDGDWWTIARDPDLGPLTTPKQQPVDFAVWQAADGTWQLWSCIRQTACGGRTRLFHRWQGAKLTEPDWTPMGVAMQADSARGETPGGLQAPYVLKIKGVYHMLYGDWENICLATSAGGKTFGRQAQPDGKTGMFTEGAGWNTRDPMVLKIGDRYHCYYTAYPNREGAVFCRTAKDLRRWSESKRVAFGGAAGTNPFAAECPFVVYRPDLKRYYLFRTQRYGQNAQTSVYSSPDPLDFGVNDDRYLIGTLPVAAPEIFEHEGQWYIAALLPSLKGIRLARLKWAPK